jgi:hypothetical protein
MKHRWLQRIRLAFLDSAIHAGRTKTMPPDDDAPDWTHSTSRLSLRMTERLRNLWRPRWIILHRQDEES